MSKTGVRRPVGLYLALGLAGLLLAGEAEAGSIVRIGPCVNPDCNVPPPNSGFIGVATGNYHSMGLRSDGSVAAWGMCDVGQCTVPGPNIGFTAISAGDSHSLALRPDGSIVAWGSNENGELYVPQSNTGFKAISTHFYHSLAVRTDGSIVAWGSNQFGQLDVPAPNAGFVAVAAGDGFSIGLKSDGTLAAWGQIDQDDVPLPTRGYLAVTANRGLADALKSEGSDPVFSEAPPISTSGGQTITALAADIDGDGDQDIVSAEYGVNLVSWYENIGTAPPVWTKRTVDGFASGPQTVAVADADRDGDLDVFSANFNDEGVAWYENSGARPPVWTKRLISGFEGPWDVYAADIDGDGDVDGFGGMRLDGPDHHGVDWYENNGASPPAFTIRRVSSGFVDAASVHAADLDRDGDVDVLSASSDDDTIAWYESDGGSRPSFARRVISRDCSGPEWVFAARLDLDADVDILAACNISGSINWYPNNANFTDSDQDGVRDDFDCAASDAAAFAVPGEIRGVRIDTPGLLSWTTEATRSGGGTRYDVLRGDLSELPVGSGRSETCRLDDGGDLPLIDPASPAVGRGFYYLVRGTNACGAGTYGASSTAAERVSSACP
jgi:hypothetical protein